MSNVLKVKVAGQRIRYEVSKVTFDDIDSISVTQGPGLVGALLVGVAYAKALAESLIKYKEDSHSRYAPSE